jgi:hypothetical protein
MAVTTGIYYHNLGNWHGIYYRLYFYPSDTRDLTAEDNSSMIQMPHDLIMGYKISRAFQDDMPFGKELLPELEIELNMNNAGTTLRNYILQTETPTLNTAYVDWNSANKQYKVPNRWVVKSGTDGVTYPNFIFEGAQERIKIYKYSNDGKVTFKILDILYSVLRNMGIDDIGHECNAIIQSFPAQIIDELVYWRYIDTYESRQFHVSNSNTDWETNKLKYSSQVLGNLDYYVKNFATDILQLYRRNDPATTNSVDSVNLFTTNWKFYKQDYTNYNAYGAQLSDIAICYINNIYIDPNSTEFVGGCMSETESEGSWGKEFKNIDNLYKMLSENFLIKLKTLTNTDGTIYLIYEPIFDDYNITGTPTIPIAVNSANIMSDWEIEQGTESEKSDCHITNSNEEDINEFPISNTAAGQDEGSVEVKNIMHNQFCNPRLTEHTDGHKRDWSDGTLSRLPLKTTVSQSLFYKDATIDGAQIRLVKVSEACYVYVDATVTEGILLPMMNPDSDFDFYEGTELIGVSQISPLFYSKMGLERSIGGMGWLTSYVLIKYFGTKKQAIMTFKSDLRYFSTNDIGRMLLIDLGSIFGYTASQFESNSPNAVITNITVSMDGVVEVKAFIRGD